MLVTPEYITDFYNGETVTVPVLGSAGESLLTVVPPEDFAKPSEAAITAKLGEIATNWQILNYSGYNFEVCGLNGALSETQPDDVLLQTPSISSSISTNSGNAYEFALQAALNPQIPQIYIAALGSGGSQGLSAAERKYVRQTGRMTENSDGRDRALPTIRALHAALADRGVRASRISTDSSGGKLGTALAAELEPEQLTHACFSAMPNMCDISGLRLVAGMVQEGQWNSRRYLGTSPDIRKVSADRVAATKATMAEFYDSIPQKLPAVRHGVRDIARVYWMARKSVGRGPNSGSPLLHDTRAVLARQPAACLRYICGELDPLCPEPKLRPNLPVFLYDAAIRASDVKVIVLPGMSHNSNAHYPRLLHSIKASVLTLPRS